MDKNEIKKYKVLYVEDELSVQKSTVEFLSRFFDSITVASNGQEGLEKFESAKFDIVITDMMMPKMNGTKMLQKIKQIDQNAVIIILSASDSCVDITECDYDVYLRKPIQFGQFVDALTEVLKKLRFKPTKN